MASQLVSLTEMYWVWIGEGLAVRVPTEAQAIDMLQALGMEYDQLNAAGRYDHACLVAELTFDRKLPAGKTYHGTIWSPVHIVLHGGVARKCLRPIPSSRIAILDKGWWTEQYMAALEDENVMRPRGNRLVEYRDVAEQQNNGMHIPQNEDQRNEVI